MIYKYRIPKYKKNHFVTIEFNELFIQQFYKLDPIQLVFETKTQDFGYENYVKDLYSDIINKYEYDLNYDNLWLNYNNFKKSYSTHFRWNIYENFCDYLVKLNKNQEAYEEWILLQEEEWGGWERDFTYRDSAIDRLIYFEGLLEKGLVGGSHIYRIAAKGSQLTEFGKRNKKEVFLVLDLIIKNSTTISYFENFYSNYKLKTHTKFKSFYYESYKSYFQHNKKAKKHWEWVLCNQSYNILKDERASINLVYMSIKEEASRLLREAENSYRLNIGAKKIGESWISETELFYKIKNIYSDLEVIQHGRPTWLGRQHFDIWIPKLNTAIEYQGQQHDKPIEFFGGIDAFEKGVRRDLLKKEKCKENKVNLIEVREGYDLNKIINEIEKGYNSSL